MTAKDDCGPAATDAGADHGDLLADDRRRARLLSGGSLAISAACALFVGIHLLVSRPLPLINIAALTAGALVFGAVTLVQRKARETRIGGLIVCIALLLIVAGLVALHGFRAPALIVLILVPMLGVFFVNVRAGFALAAASIGVVITAWCTGLPDHPLTGGVSAARMDIIFAVLVVLLICTVTYLSWLFESTRRAAWELMQSSLARADAARRQAELADRAKSAFLATVSHEIRTPLHGVVGGLSLLEDTGVADAQRDVLDIVLQSGDSLLQLVDAILDISRIEAGEVALLSAPCGIARIVDSVIAVNSARARRRDLELHATIDADVPRVVVVDSARLEQVLNNLVSNGLKFTARGGVQLHVRCAAGDTNDESDAPSDAGGARRQALQFVVSDSGDGVPAELRERIFAPFVQADSGTARNHGGAGLGLAISRQVARAMGGDITLVDTAKPGSTFMLSLQLAVGEDALPQEPTAQTDAEAALHGRVLVVDDNAVNADVVARLLTAIGVQSDVATSGAQALRRVASRRYDVVLMDCEMPEMDGFETTRRLLAAAGTDAPPVVALTAHRAEEVGAQCTDAGMIDVWNKPLTLRTLRRALARYLGPIAEAGADASRPNDPHAANQVDSAGPDAPALLIDTSLLKQLQSDTAQQSPGFVTRLIEVFAKSARRDVQAVTAASAAADLGAIAFATHRLKGSAGNLGATQLSDHAARMNRLAGGDDLQATRALAAQLPGLLDATLAALRTFAGDDTGG